MTGKEALAVLAAAFPRSDRLPSATLHLYEQKMADIPGPVLAEAVSRLIDSAKFLPAIAEIRHMAAQVTHLLPAPAEEALAIVRKADVREDIYRRDGSFAYTERYWRFPEGVSAVTTRAIETAFARCGDIVGREGKDQFGWEQGFKTSYQAAAVEIEGRALRDLSGSALPLALPQEPALLALLSHSAK